MNARCDSIRLYERSHCVRLTNVLQRVRGRGFTAQTNTMITTSKSSCAIQRSVKYRVYRHSLSYEFTCSVISKANIRFIRVAVGAVSSTEFCTCQIHTSSITEPPTQCVLSSLHAFVVLGIENSDTCHQQAYYCLRFKLNSCRTNSTELELLGPWIYHYFSFSLTMQNLTRGSATAEGPRDAPS